MMISSTTQTDWENDVPATKKKVTLKMPKTPNTSNDSLLSEIEDSFREESLDSDSTWQLSDSEEEDVSTEFDNDSEDVELVNKERKFIVYETQLDKLLNKCSKCNNLLSVTKTVSGCMLKCVRECDICAESDTWYSQPSTGTMAVGHLELAAAILLSGSGPTKFLRALQFAGISTFKLSTYFNIQSAYLSPAVFTIWEDKQSAMITQLKESGQSIRVGGDGRCCSPGHTAKYGTYTTINLETGKILDIQLVQVRL